MAIRRQDTGHGSAKTASTQDGGIVFLLRHKNAFLLLLGIIKQLTVNSEQLTGSCIFPFE